MKLGPLKLDLMYVLMIAVLVITLLGAGWLAKKAITEVDKAGGVKQIIITIGKEIKDIGREIDKEDWHDELK